jgi:hypothetical protein
MQNQTSVKTMKFYIRAGKMDGKLICQSPTLWERTKSGGMLKVLKVKMKEGQLCGGGGGSVNL